MKTTIDDVYRFGLRVFYEDSGRLIPVELESDMPFPVKRIFYVRSNSSETVRGKHAHYKTKQVYVCMSGEADVNYYDGNKWGIFKLNCSHMALFVPEGIWAEETYKKPDTVLLVFANTKYDARDYITDIKEFENWKKEQ